MVDEADARAEAKGLAEKWFAKPAGRVSDGNDVTAYIEGADAFREIADQLLSANVGKNTFVLWLGWSMHLDFELKPGDKTSTLRAILTEVTQRGAALRVMVWKNWMAGFDNAPAVTLVQGLPGADAILDNRTAIAGSHHQKILVIYGERQTIAYCGGMDPWSDRIAPGGFGPLHDVHCRVEGPAADELWTVFEERWNDHPAHTKRFPGALAKPSRPRITVGGTMAVQVGRTYPCMSTVSNAVGLMGYTKLKQMVEQYDPEAAKEIPPVGDMNDGAGKFKPYSFAPRGEQGVWQMIEQGIKAAARFVYVEDQYLLSRAASGALAAKLKAHAKDKAFRVIILICHTDIVDVEQAWQRRAEFIADLAAADPSRTMWTVSHRAPIGSPKSYVHSKTWIFDDTLAIVGSANCSRRCYTEDSECDIGVLGRAAGSRVGPGGVSLPLMPFAQSLRCALWAKHLGRTPADWADPMNTAAAWFKPPKGSSIATYDPKAKKDPPSPKKLSETMPGYPTIHDLYWNNVIDPDGNC